MAAELRGELLSFPAGRHDDQVDAVGLVGQLLDIMAAGTAPNRESARPRDGYGGYRAVLSAEAGTDWKIV